MIVTEILLAISTPISALIDKCVKDEIHRIHAHLIERVEELEQQLASKPKSPPQDHHINDPLLLVLL